MRIERERCPFTDAQLTRIREKRVDERAIDGFVAAAFQDVEPVRVAPEIAKSPQVLQRHPERAAALRILGDECRSDDDLRSHLTTAPRSPQASSRERFA